jgi:hypothetical protein
MSVDPIFLLTEGGYSFHTRSKGSSGECWWIGSKSSEQDHGERQGRIFLASNADPIDRRQIRFRFYVTRTALAMASIRQTIGDPDTFLLEAGLTRLKELLRADDSALEYEDVVIHSRSARKELEISTGQDLDAEILRVRQGVLGLLRANAYGGKKRTSKADVAAAVCTADVVLNRVLSTLQQRGLIEGAYGGNMKVTAKGEAEFERALGSPTPVRLGSPMSMPTEPKTGFDVFVSHASEDKDPFVRALVRALASAGLKVWYDESTLRLGDSLRASIDKGLGASRYGIVIFSHAFFAKEWPQRELSALFALMRPGQRKVLPVWHDITADELRQYSPMVADLLAVRSSEGMDAVVSKILDAVKS